VRGTVVDSLAEGAALAGAIVQLAPVSSPGGGGGRSMVTDANGAFQFDSVAPGRYVAGFFHPTLDSLGLQMPIRSVEVGSAEVVVQLGVPSGAAIMTSVCGPATGSGADDGSGLLLGTVRDAASGAPIAGSEALVEWMELVIGDGAIAREMQQLPAVTSATGTFAVCDVPSDTPVQLSAVLGADTSGFAEVTVPARGLLHRDVYLGRGDGVSRGAAASGEADIASVGEWPARRGSAIVTGVIVTDRGEPIEGAQVSDLSSGVADTSRAEGRFRLTALPAGTTTIEARAIGYRPVRTSVDARAGVPDSVRIAFTEPVDMLDRVTVYGERRTNWDRDAFMRRMQSGLGRYLGMDDIEKRHAFAVTDLLRGFPGVRIVQTRMGESILIRDCAPAVVLDGVPVMDGATTIRSIIAPVDVGGIEVYNSGAFMPPDFAGYANGCGLIAVWTKYRLAR
jgi:hypothetical protein